MILCLIKVNWRFPCLLILIYCLLFPSDLLRHRCEPPTLHLSVSLRHVDQGRRRAAADRTEELWPEARGHCEVCVVFFHSSKHCIHVLFCEYNRIISTVFLLQRARFEAANLPGHCLLRSLRQGWVPLGKAEASGVLSSGADHIPVLKQSRVQSESQNQCFLNTAVSLQAKVSVVCPLLVSDPELWRQWSQCLCWRLNFDSFILYF